MRYGEGNSCFCKLVCSKIIIMGNKYKAPALTVFLLFYMHNFDIEIILLYLGLIKVNKNCYFNEALLA